MRVVGFSTCCRCWSPDQQLKTLLTFCLILSTIISRYNCMLKTLTALLFFLSTAAMAQYRRQPTPTQFDTFINNSKIEWAAYANDTVRFKKLNNLLVERLAKKQIKASLPVYNGLADVNHIVYLPERTINDKILYPPNSIPIYDSAGDPAGYKIVLRPYQIDTAAFTVTDITEILYIENGVVKSYIPWVSPRVIPVSTSIGVFLGYTDYFSTCFSFNANVLPVKKNKTIFLSQTKRNLKLDTVETESRLKETYGRNMLETLWPYVMQHKYRIFSFEKDTFIRPEQIKELTNGEKVMVPVYDASGNITGRIADTDMYPGCFINAAIVQDWYYDETRNIVLNKVREIILYTLKSGPDDDKPIAPFIKIILE